MKKPIVAIVQARMGASRLPNKMMLWLHGYPVVEWVFRRVSQSHLLDRIVFAIPDTESDNILADYLSSLECIIYRGSESDVLDRMVKAASLQNAATVVRICADNPFVSGSEIDRLIEFYLQGDYDYAYNHIPRGNSYPDGLGAEISDMKILETIHRNADKQSQREHVFNYIWDNQLRFKIGTCDPIDDKLAHPELKLDLDSEKDYISLLRLPVHPNMSAGEIVAIVLKHEKKLLIK